MIDEQSSTLDIASEVGFRVVQTGADSYQFQRVNNRGVTTAVTPTHQHAFELWRLFVSTAQQLGKALEGGKDGDGAEPDKSGSPKVA